jgi:hypothetical protein
MNTLSTDATPSNEEALMRDWLADYIHENVDFNASSRNEEYLKLRDYVADATASPVEMVTVDKMTEGGKLYFKLKVMARDERAKSRMEDIKLIEFEHYSHMEKVRANAHAALHYAKQIHADRPKVTVMRKDGCKFTCSSEFKAITAIQKNAYYNRYQKSNLNYQASIETKDTEHLTTVV